MPREFPDMDFEAFVGHLKEHLHQVDLFPVVHRPPQQDRQRMYVHLLDFTGKPVAFVKVGLDQHNNA